MTVIRSFDGLDHLNAYYKDSLNHSLMTQITQENLSSFLVSYPITAFSDNENYLHTPHYIYCNSKTSYRKNIHSFIPNVLYKKFYSSLKSSGHILEATGSHVLLCDKPIEQSIYISIQTQSQIDNQKVLSQLLDNFSNIVSDNEYYLAYISSLEEKYKVVIEENEHLKNQLYNTKISTWY